MSGNELELPGALQQGTNLRRAPYLHYFFED